MFKKTKLCVFSFFLSVMMIGFVFVANAGTVTLPSGLQEIERGAFQNDDTITTVILPEGLTVLHDRAFYNCANLSFVYMPSSVKSIGEDVFANCPKVILFGIENSEAEFYALKNDLLFCCVENSNIIDYGVCGSQVYWTLDNTDLLTISGNGRMTD